MEVFISIHVPLAALDHLALHSYLKANLTPAGMSQWLCTEYFPIIFYYSVAKIKQLADGNSFVACREPNDDPRLLSLQCFSQYYSHSNNKHS